MSEEANRWSGRNAAKDELRERVWAALETAGAVVGDPRGGIPDFDSADAAAARLAELPFWKEATVVKCTPDACQAPIRLRVLQEGKLLYMAYPQLKVYPCFIELDRDDLLARGVSLEEASTMDGAIKHGRGVPFEEMKHIDIVNVGSVAVTLEGGRTGKGAGFADLELGLLSEFGLVDETTVIVSTVHPLSIVPAEDLPLAANDAPLDWVVTEDIAHATETTLRGPGGLLWDQVRPDQLETIPVLAMLAEQRAAQ